MEPLPGEVRAPRSRSPFMSALSLIVPVIVVLLIIFPGYRDQRAREELMVLADQAERMAQAVETFRQKNSRLPVSVEEAGFDEYLAPYARQVTIAPDGGIVIEYQGPLIDGKKLSVVRIADANGKPAWKCTAEADIPEAYVPVRCR